MNKPQFSLRNKALDLLSRREYSLKELEQRLYKYSDDVDKINEVLQTLVEQNLLSDERYIENFIASKSKKYGSLKLKYLLNSKVSDRELVDEIYKNSTTNELDTAHDLLLRKYGAPPENQNERAKYLRFLLSRGFSMSMALSAIKALSNDE